MPDVIRGCLKWKSSVRKSSTFGYPLEFHGTHGVEVLDGVTGSYYNTAEADTVLERITNLDKNWPEKDWGKKDLKRVAVVTAYAEQVMQLFNHL